MTWRIRADCTYTNASRKSSAQSAAQATLDASTDWEAVEGNFGAGITSISSTRFTVSINCPTFEAASSLMNSLRSDLTGQSRSETFFACYEEPV